MSLVEPTNPAEPDEVERRALRLYVVGRTPAAVRAIDAIRELHQGLEHDGWTLEVVDVLRRPELAEADRISAVPALVRKLPRPVRRVVGDLSDMDRVLLGLEIRDVQAG